MQDESLREAVLAMQSPISFIKGQKKLDVCMLPRKMRICLGAV
jgi:hypothetical protein